MKKFASLFLCMLMIAGLVSGCGNSGNTEPAASPAASESAAAPAASESAAAPAASESAAPAPADAKYKEDIVIGISGKIISLDPQENSNTQHNYYFRMVFDTLIDFDNQTQELKPCVATEWSTEDAITYTFKLRDDVVFHNGEPLKASDVVWTFQRAPGTGSSSPLGNMMTEVKAIDDYTVEITLDKKNVDFPYLLTLPTASLMSQKAVEDDPTEGTGIGSGPFKLDSYEFGGFLKVVRNEDFWGEVTPTKSVNLRYMPENSPRLIALQTGEIDVCQDPDTLELSHIEDDPNLELQTYMGSSITYVAFNYKKAPFDNQDFRLAVCYGIDAQEMIDVVRDGKAQKCLSLWGWNQYAYNGGIGINGESTSYEYNPELAKEYLAKAFPNGGASFKLSISSGDRKAIGELMQAQLKQIGIDVELVEYDTAGLSTTTTAGEHDACVYGCGMNIFGDDARRLICPGTGVNKSHYDNPRVNELMDLAVAEQDDAQRTAYYEEVQQVCFDDGAYMPIYFTEAFFGVKQGVSGIDFYPTSHHDFSNIVMIEQ